MRVNHCVHRTVAASRMIQRHRRGGDLDRGQRVDDDDASGALHDGQVGEIEAAHLKHLLGHLKQPVVHVQAGHTPQARVHRWRRDFGVEKSVLGQVPDRRTTGGATDRAGQGGDEAAGGISEVRGVGKIRRCRLRRDRRRAVGPCQIAHWCPPPPSDGEDRALWRCPRSLYNPLSSRPRHRISCEPGK